MQFEIHEESAAHVRAVRDVLQAAFGRPDEAQLVDRLRAAGAVVASLVAVVDEDVVGHILFSDLPIVTPENRKLRGVALAPVAVRPAFQGEGIGGVLVRAGVNACRERGYEVAIVVGEPGYYTRFGFSIEAARPIQSEFSGDYFMALELVPGVLSGVTGRAVYHPAFGDLT